MPGFRRLGSSWLRASALGLALCVAMRDDMGVYAAEALQSTEEDSAQARRLALAGRPMADAWVEVQQAEEGQLYGTLAAALSGGREARAPGRHDPPTKLPCAEARGQRTCRPISLLLGLLSML